MRLCSLHLAFEALAFQERSPDGAERNPERKILHCVSLHAGYTLLLGAAALLLNLLRFLKGKPNQGCRLGWGERTPTFLSLLVIKLQSVSLLDH